MRRARTVVLAAPAYAAATLVRELAPAAAQGLAAIDYAAIASVATAYRRADIAHSLAGFGFLVPKKERRTILGSLFSSSMFEGRAPEGTVLLTTFIGGRRNPELPAKPDAELARSCATSSRALVGARGEPLWTEITRWTHAIPQYNLGHLERLRPVEAAERALPGLFFCANYRGGVSVGDCIKSAHATADAVARFLADARCARVTCRMNVPVAGQGGRSRTAAPHFQHRSNVAGFSSPHAGQNRAPPARCARRRMRAAPPPRVRGRRRRRATPAAARRPAARRRRCSTRAR